MLLKNGFTWPQIRYFRFETKSQTEFDNKNIDYSNLKIALSEYPMRSALASKGIVAGKGSP